MGTRGWLQAHRLGRGGYRVGAVTSRLILHDSGTRTKKSVAGRFATISQNPGRRAPQSSTPRSSWQTKTMSTRCGASKTPWTYAAWDISTCAFVRTARTDDFISCRYLIHGPLPTKKARLASWKACQEGVRLGWVKSIGVSNFGNHHLKGVSSSAGRRVH